VVWRLSAREARVRFLSQDLTVTIPATGDVHRVLKYLALVQPRPWAEVRFPTEDNSYALVFTAEPKRFDGSEWDRAHFVTPATLGTTRQP